MSKTRGRYLTAAAVVMVGLMLAGCTADFRSAVREQDGSLIFEVCDPTAGNQVTVSAVRAGEHQYKTVWKAIAPKVVNVSQVIDFDESVPPFVATSDLGSVADYEKIQIVVAKRDGSATDTTHAASFSVGQIRESDWLRSDGSHDRKPCD